MSYAITLWCGCSVYVSCDPKTGLAHARILDRRSAACTDRRHEVGLRLRLWEMLPDPRLREPQIEYYALDAPLPPDRVTRPASVR
jgi:hypothetical protein